MKSVHISFVKSTRTDLTCQSGDNLMKVLLEAKVPVASSCHGDAVCGKCKVQVLQGAQNLSPIQDPEQFLLHKNKIPQGWRISCQCQVLGDVTLDTGYW